MKLILAIDLKDGLVVHGKSGNRKEYVPLTDGLSPSAEPVSYVTFMKPKYLYAADLDRISMEGDHTETILKLAGMVKGLYADRGTTIPEEYLPEPIHTIVGTETVDAPLEEFSGGFLSIDIKDGVVIPSGEDPAEFLKTADSAAFDGYIILNISSVGTGCGISEAYVKELRAATKKQLFYGGGVASAADLETLQRAGFDGAIISTAVHNRQIPLELIREGELC
ncbi:MAG TPA: HisA/HisF-related TIM barrel protein [Methanocorpusculum sp.]|nr:nickel transporter [Candidatus Methanocorpusculum equi]MCQ2358260.1 HisA/HisF-related TIM barrel protein [Methanocorpusculum sp.]HJJ33463.1 HisA/HisF-related TIM barrel protein [Methanocorpusculum sp.]HJJ45093.1 HisA/HisF-related TIM barrel protein [Methanocorpusculum sp.]HJJ60027.1 HisA/HisF-related TIM barrel protein [Methanocorpusculum sp.]